MKLYWNFQRGGEVLEKIPSVGKVWIFSGTTQSDLTFLSWSRNDFRYDPYSIMKQFVDLSYLIDRMSGNAYNKRY